MPDRDWTPGRWWQVLAPDDSIWCETSDEDEARAAMRPSDTLRRLYERNEQEWRAIPPESSDACPACGHALPHDGECRVVNDGLVCGCPHPADPSVIQFFGIERGES